ncbi:MAG: hypothetical protein EZS28_027163 [Streblomastix strix]|uniref:Uncharacterized protein n=1 Tax=Streblomastix strix TaxID=222440 RepID=A0A5J4V3I5_9EUKA|nr:MAG: hypothetical protein EZS28_027163 [Streblomastix strix]
MIKILTFAHALASFSFGFPERKEIIDCKFVPEHDACIGECKINIGKSIEQCSCVIGDKRSICNIVIVDCADITSDTSIDECPCSLIGDELVNDPREDCKHYGKKQ